MSTAIERGGVEQARRPCSLLPRKEFGALLLSPWKRQDLTWRQWVNDTYWRPWKGWAVVDGHWRHVGVSALATSILGAAVIVGGGTASREAPKASRQPANASSHVLALGPMRHDPVPTTTTEAPTTSRPPAVVRGSALAGGGDRRACILARENAHDPNGPYARSSNPSHFGAYQFDRQTWAAAGGDPSHWGSASKEEQDAAFNNYVAHYGYGAWAPYDGC